jgi:hypothetical protein
LQQQVRQHLGKLRAGRHYLGQLIELMDNSSFKLTLHHRNAYYREIVNRDYKSKLIESFEQRIQVMLLWEDLDSNGEKFSKVKISVPSWIESGRYVEETKKLLSKVFID